MIIQCDSNRITGDLIACARYRIYDLRAKAAKEQITHVLFVIHLPRSVTNSSFVGFQGDPWVSFHVDDLTPTDDSAIIVGEAILLKISELFLGRPKERAEHEENDDDYNTACEDSINISSIELSEEELPSSVNTKSLTIGTPCYRRLHDCIQAAASKLKDVTNKRCTERVTILVHLISSEPSNPQGISHTSVHCSSCARIIIMCGVLLPNVRIEFGQFCDVLIRHIYKVLQEHDEVREDKKDWVMNEAKNPKSLQHGGTFRNVLSRKIDDVIIPIFSEIIASIDQNFNLDLIYRKGEDLPFSQFWLCMFRNSSIMQFNYTDMVTPREQVPGLGGRKTREDFKCEFPFSWLVYEAVESQWDNAKCSAGEKCTL